MSIYGKYGRQIVFLRKNFVLLFSSCWSVGCKMEMVLLRNSGFCWSWRLLGAGGENWSISVTHCWLSSSSRLFTTSSHIGAQGRKEPDLVRGHQWMAGVWGEAERGGDEKTFSLLLWAFGPDRYHVYYVRQDKHFPTSQNQSANMQWHQKMLQMKLTDDCNTFGTNSCQGLNLIEDREDREGKRGGMRNCVSTVWGKALT